MNVQSAEQPTTGQVGRGRRGHSFAGSDSRKYNYFEPKGRKATHYEDMTVDVQPDPEALSAAGLDHLFADGTPTYSEDLDRGQKLELAQVPRRRPGMGAHPLPAPVDHLRHDHRASIENARRSGAPKRFDKTWVKVLQDHLGAYKHAEFGLGTATMQAQRYGYTQMINNAILTNSSYKLRFAQDLTLYLSEIGAGPARFRSRRRQAALARGSDLAGHAPGGRSDHAARPTFSSSISPTNRRLRAAGRRAVPQRLHHAGRRPRRTISSRRRSSPPPKATTSATSPMPSNCSTCLRNDPMHGEHNRKLFNAGWKQHGALASRPQATCSRSGRSRT